MTGRRLPKASRTPRGRSSGINTFLEMFLARQQDPRRDISSGAVLGFFESLIAEASDLDVGRCEMAFDEAAQIAAGLELSDLEKDIRRHSSAMLRFRDKGEVDAALIEGVRAAIAFERILVAVRWGDLIDGKRRSEEARLRRLSEQTSSDQLDSNRYIQLAVGYLANVAKAPSYSSLKAHIARRTKHSLGRVERLFPRDVARFLIKGVGQKQAES